MSPSAAFRIFFFSCAVTLGATAGVARAQDGVDPASKAQAEALFAEGTALLEQGDTAKACPKLEAAVELTKGEALGGKLVLGRCYEASGRFASAWGLYNEVAARAAKAQQPERAQQAQLAAEAALPKVHRLTLGIPKEVADLPGLRVELGGRPLAKAAWSSSLPIDPGSLELVVTADGKVPFTSKVTIPAEPGSTTVDVPVLDDLRVEVPSTQPKGTVKVETSFWSGERIAGLVLGLTGLAALGGSGGLAAVAVGKYDDGLEAGGCNDADPPVCEDASALDDGRAYGDAATGVFFAGLGTLVVGVIVFATVPNVPVTTAAPTARIVVRPTWVGLTVDL